MSLARNLNTYDRIVEGSAVKAIPSVEREPRTETRPAARPRRQKSMRGIMVGALGWALILVLSLSVVYRNSLVLAESQQTTAHKAELMRLEREIEAQQAALTQLHTVAEVEKWAAANGFQRPMHIKTAKADPAAAVAYVAPAPAAVAQAKPVGFMGTVKNALARIAGGVAKGN